MRNDSIYDMEFFCEGDKTLIFELVNCFGGKRKRLGDGKRLAAYVYPKLSTEAKNNYDQKALQRFINQYSKQLKKHEDGGKGVDTFRFAVIVKEVKPKVEKLKVEKKKKEEKKEVKVEEKK